MMTTERKKIRTAKAGETLSPKAAAYMREHYPFMKHVLTTNKLGQLDCYPGKDAPNLDDGDALDVFSDQRSDRQ